jgi:hypothetical protein
MELTYPHKDGLMTEESFEDYMSNFYATAVQYIKEWSLYPFSVFAKMEWVSLSTSFCWENITEVLKKASLMTTSISKCMQLKIK